ncbi:MAG TPA: DUF4388 domain-containing protein [Candidatus Sulfotelmatobacter sp.]|nr:DUF4388 domain-containing protein [Candidatus Sulfotelmatobacter sp.]
MGLAGKLEDLALVDIFQMISMTKKTGRLSLTQPKGYGVIIFKNGHIIFAASDVGRESLGEVLVRRNVIKQQALDETRDIQRRSLTGKRVATILVEKSYVTKEALEEVVAEETVKIISQFFGWKTADFEFEVATDIDTAEFEADAKDFVLKNGLNVDQIVRDCVRQSSASPAREPAENAVPSPSTPSAAVPSAPSARHAAPPEPTPKPTPTPSPEPRSSPSLKDVAASLMRQAAALVSRGVLFCQTQSGIRGMSQFGLQMNGTNPDDRVRKLILPYDEPSVLSAVNSTKQTYLGKLEKSSWNEHLVAQLGGSAPSEVVVVPMMVGGMAALIFYGDGLPANRTSGEVERLELLVMRAGLEMEKTLLEKKAKTLDQRGADSGLSKKAS